MKKIKFKIQNIYYKYLYEILKNINDESYVWNVYDSEVFDSLGNSFFTKDVYSNEEFFELIQQECYLVFLDLRLYDDNNQLILNLIVIDCEFVEMHFNSLDVLNLILINIKNDLFKDIKFLD